MRCLSRQKYPLPGLMARVQSPGPTWVMAVEKLMQSAVLQLPHAHHGAHGLLSDQ